MNKTVITGLTLGTLALLFSLVGCSSSSDGSPPPWIDILGVWDVTFDEIVDSCWDVEDKNLLWKLERSGSDMLKKEYNKDTQLCGPTDLLEGDAFEESGDVDLQITVPMDRNGCAETYTVTVIGSWSAAGFDFNVVEQWTADNPADPDCVENYPCDREYDLTATPSADPFPAQCDV